MLTISGIRATMRVASSGSFTLVPVAARYTPQATTTRRALHVSARRFAEAAPAILPARKPVGAFRGGLFGFLTGAVTAAGAMYYYVLEEYRVSNELLTEDIFKLSATVARVESYVKVLEDKVDTLSRKR